MQISRTKFFWGKLGLSQESELLFCLHLTTAPVLKSDLSYLILSQPFCHQDLVFRAWKSGFQNFAWIEKVGIWLEIVAYYTIEMYLKLCITLQNNYCSYCNYIFIGVGTGNDRICHDTDIVHLLGFSFDY